MKTTILILLTAALLAGCGQVDRALSMVTGDASRVCVDGVQYLQFTSGASVAYTPDGKVKTCGK